MLLFICKFCGKTNSKFFKNQEISGLLSQSRIRNEQNIINYQKEQLLTKSYMRRHSKMLIIDSMIDINVVLHQQFTKSFIKNLEGPLLIQGPELFLRIRDWSMNYINLKIFEVVKYTHLIDITLGVLILQTCNY